MANSISNFKLSELHPLSELVSGLLVHVKYMSDFNSTNFISL
jgi:hypothetical protein